MKHKNNLALITSLAAHLAMGASLELAFGFCLIEFDIAHLEEIIQSAFDPGATLAVLIGSLALEFGVGATLTGFILIKIDGG